MSVDTKDFEFEGFSPAVRELFERHSGRLVRLGLELDARDKVKWNLNKKDVKQNEQPII